jgi:pyruvate kinase
MLREGANVFRVNCSFGDHDVLGGYINAIREASKQTNIPVSILGDLQGPKFRTGDMEVPSIPLKEGQRYPFLATKEKGNLTRITTPNEILVKCKIISFLLASVILPFLYFFLLFSTFCG